MPYEPHPRRGEPAEGAAATVVAVASGPGPGAEPLSRPAARPGAWPFVWLLVMGVLWGSTFSLAKIATEGGAHPLGLSLWQGLIGGVLLLALCLARRRLPPLSRQHLGFYAVCGLIGTVIPGTLFFYAAPHVPAGVLSIAVALVPMLTYAATAVLRTDVLSRGRLLGIALGLGSVVLLVAPESALPSPDMAPWVLLAVLSSAFYAAENVYVALKRPAEGDTLAIVCGMLIMGAALLVPAVLATGSFVPMAVPWGPVEGAVAAMAAASAIAYSLFVHVIRTAGPVFASQAAYTVIIAGVLWGMAIFGETHSLWIWGSLGVMLVGLALVNPYPAREKKKG